MPNLDSIVRVEISGHKFDVPLRYLYGEGKERLGRWPTPKAERRKLDTLQISVLLPDLRPYRPEDDARWTALGFGDRLHVLLMKPVGRTDWFPFVLRLTLDEVERGLASPQPDTYGLKSYRRADRRKFFLEKRRFVQGEVELQRRIGI